MLDRSAHSLPGIAAARLTLLALRSATFGGTQAAPGVVTLVPGTAPVPLDAAARQLAPLPKPLRCAAEVRDGVLTVTAEPLARQEPLAEAPAAPDADREITGCRRLPEPSPFAELLGDRASVDLHRTLVACVGAGDAVRLTVSEFEEWERDYRLHDASGLINSFARSYAAIDEDFTCPDLPGLTPELLEGATVLVQFSEQDELPCHVWQLPVDAEPLLWCEDCDARRAEVRVLDRELGYWRERSLCGACHITEDVVPGVPPGWPEAAELAELEALEREVGQPIPLLAEYAEILVRAEEKSGVPMPPEVEAYVRRHDGRSG